MTSPKIVLYCTMYSVPRFMNAYPQLLAYHEEAAGVDQGLNSEEHDPLHALERQEGMFLRRMHKHAGIWSTRPTHEPRFFSILKSSRFKSSRIV